MPADSFCMFFKRLLPYLVLILAIILLSFNLVGLFKEIRPSNITSGDLRFSNERQITFDEAMKQLVRVEGETDEDFARRLAGVVSDSLAHIHWNEEPDNRRFNQLVPIWENYFIHFMGLVSGIPEYEKYHFADYRRSLERGIGICGDASMIMSQVLEKEGIPNELVSFPGHVIVAATINGKETVFDPDFGVSLPYSVGDINNSPKLIEEYYLNQGYSRRDANALMRSFSRDFRRWNGVEHFITKKYYFEKAAYFLKWPFPIALMVFSVYLLHRSRLHHQYSLGKANAASA